MGIPTAILGQLLPFARPTEPSLEWLVRSESCPIAHEYVSAEAVIRTLRLLGSTNGRL